MRFAFIDAEKARWPTGTMCRVLKVSRSGYYRWRERPREALQQQERRLRRQIRRHFKQSRETYGSPRIQAVLQAEGLRVGVNRVARLMRLEGLRARTQRRFRRPPSPESRSAAPNLLSREFGADQPNRKWAADITYIRTLQGWLYLAVLLDLFSRRVVGWGFSPRVGAELTLQALQMALHGRRVKPGLLVHSDRGVQYSATPYLQKLDSVGAVSSMSRRGDCWDNAVVESFFASLKKELVRGRVFPTRRQARTEIFEYIEVFYNRQRRHSSLGYLSPYDYELRALQALST